MQLAKYVEMTAVSTWRRARQKHHGISLEQALYTLVSPELLTISLLPKNRPHRLYKNNTSHDENQLVRTQSRS